MRRFVDPVWLTRQAPFALELFFLACDVWATLCIPSSLTRAPTFYAPLKVVLYQERRLQMLAATAALLIATGFATTWCRARYCHGIASTLRAIGLGGSGALWLSIAISFLIAEPFVLSGVPFLLMGVLAFGMVLRWPPLPVREPPA